MASKIRYNKHANFIALLEAKTTPEPNTGCLLWTFSADKNGYGKLSYEGKHRRAHCVAYEYHHGPIPAGHLVQHTCDTPACCNIDHLRLGTPLTNMQDKVAKGRLRNQHMKKTHCPRGHAYSYFYNGRRSCRICTQSVRRIKRGLAPYPEY